MKKIYIIAFILAFLTAASVYTFSGALEKASRRSYTEVVTAAVNVTERTALTAEMLVIKSIPSEAVLPTAIRRINDAVGLFTDNMLEKGEVLSTAKLHATGEKTSGLTYMIPDGQRAFTLSVDAVSGVGGFILPGDRIDIIASMSVETVLDGKTIQSPLSIVISQNLEVLAAGANINVVENGTTVSYSTLTLSVTLDEAVKLNLAAANGKLRMVLRSRLDKKVNEVSPQTPVSMINSTLGPNQKIIFNSEKKP